MNYTLTTNLDGAVYTFLDEQSKATKSTKKSIIEEALRMYQKNLLASQITAGLNERYSEYKELNGEFHDVQLQSLQKNHV